MMAAVLPTASLCPVCGRRPTIDRCEPWPADEGPAPFYAVCYGLEPVEHCTGANGDTRGETIRAWNAECAAAPEGIRVTRMPFDQPAKSMK